MHNKLIKIYSHPRSGTNYLGALLKENFYKNIDLSTYGEWGHWSNRVNFDKPVLHGKLLGNHLFKEPKNSTPKIYVYRDGRDVCLSMWRSYNFNNKNLDVPLSEYLKHVLDWNGSPGFKYNSNKSIVEHWYQHLNIWLKYANKRDDILLIRYEDLLLNTEDVLNNISKSYNIEYDKKFTNIKSLVGPSSNTGKLMTWKEYFTEADLEYFFSIVKNNKFLWSDHNKNIK